MRAAGDRAATAAARDRHASSFRFAAGCRTNGACSAAARWRWRGWPPANADLFLSGHLHISHVSHAVDRYEVAGHSGLIVQAGTVSTRGRGEQPSFNVLRLHRPEIELSRHAWEAATASFTPAVVGRYRHGPTAAGLL